MKLPHIKEYAKKGLTSIPYQLIGDSPTTKYYTRWSYYTPYIEFLAKYTGVRGEYKTLGPGKWLVNVGPGCQGLSRSIKGVLYASTSNANVGVSVENKVLAAHYVALDKVDVLHVIESPDETLTINLCYPKTFSKWVSRHLIIVVDPDVGAKLLIRDVSVTDVDYAVSTIIEFIVGNRSSIELVEVNVPSSRSPSYYLRRMIIGDEARVSVYGISSAGLMHHQREDFVLKKNSILVNRRLCVGRGNTRSDNIINVVHRGAFSNSSIEAYGIALDSSYIVVRGVARVSEESKHASTVFKTRVLLLGRESKGYTAPMIEVDTGDIKQASHSASQYRLSVDELFYLRTRGLGLKEVEELIVNGLADKVIGDASIDVELIRSDLELMGLKPAKL